MLVRNPNKRSVLGKSAALNKSIEAGSSKTARTRNKLHCPPINRTTIDRSSLGSGGASSFA